MEISSQALPLKVVNTEELAGFLDVSPRKVRRWVRTGLIWPLAPDADRYILGDVLDQLRKVGEAAASRLREERGAKKAPAKPRATGGLTA